MTEHLTGKYGISNFDIGYQESGKLTKNLATDDYDYMHFVANVGRVVAIGDCCWNRKDHFNKNGEQQDWAKVGDFVSFPKHVGSKRKFKGVSYLLLTDDEINEQLPDPQIFDQEGYYTLDIPQEDLEKYNTIYKKENN